jgi:hypothetical protein
LKHFAFLVYKKYFFNVTTSVVEPYLFVAVPAPTLESFGSGSGSGGSRQYSAVLKQQKISTKSCP